MQKVVILVKENNRHFTFTALYLMMCVTGRGPSSAVARFVGSGADPGSASLPHAGSAIELGKPSWARAAPPNGGLALGQLSLSKLQRTLVGPGAALVRRFELELQ